MDYNEKEARYKQHVMLLVGIMVVFGLTMLFLPPLRRWWDVGVVQFDKMTCYLCLLTLAVVVLGSRRKEKKLWGAVPPPAQPKTVFPFIISLVLLCACEGWVANFITTSIIHASEIAYDHVYDTVCRYINSIYFVGVTIWMISAEANTRYRQRWAQAHPETTEIKEETEQ